MAHFSTAKNLERDKRRSRLRSKFRRLLDRAATLQSIFNNEATNEVVRDSIRRELLDIKDSIINCETRLREFDEDPD